MIGAAVVVALALTGVCPVVVSDAQPRAGRDYLAVRYTRGGELECGAGIVGAVSIKVRYTPAGCVLAIPRGTAGSGSCSTGISSRRVSRSPS